MYSTLQSIVKNYILRICISDSRNLYSVYIFWKLLISFILFYEANTYLFWLFTVLFSCLTPASIFVWLLEGFLWLTYEVKIDRYQHILSDHFFFKYKWTIYGLHHIIWSVNLIYMNGENHKLSIYIWLITIS